MNVKLWCGVLEAGEQTSVMVFNPEHGANEPAVANLFHAVRNTILGYQVVVVKPKLRPLTADELAAGNDAVAAYARVLRKSAPVKHRRAGVLALGLRDVMRPQSTEDSWSRPDADEQAAARRERFYSPGETLESAALAADGAAQE